jgi:hypothetical protein
MKPGRLRDLVALLALVSCCMLVITQGWAADDISCLIWRTTLAGAFCISVQQPNIGGNNVFCKPIAQYLASKLFAGHSVVDLGGGLGFYARTFKQARKKGLPSPTNVRCFDGSPHVAAVTANLCQTLDLSIIQNIEQSDWVLSLEVGEHIPKRYESAYLDNLHSANKLGMVLSWAVPAQGGYMHVNERDNAYIQQKMVALGYIFDVNRTAVLRDLASLRHSCRWFMRSIMVFQKHDLSETTGR